MDITIRITDIPHTFPESVFWGVVQTPEFVGAGREIRRRQTVSFSDMPISAVAIELCIAEEKTRLAADLITAVYHAYVDKGDGTIDLSQTESIPRPSIGDLLARMSSPTQVHPSADLTLKERADS